MPPIRLISFGYLHQPADCDGTPIPPTADRVEDVRERLRDPAAARGILELDGSDSRVQHVVFNTPGARELLLNLADYAELPAAPASIAIGCAGGRHRAAALVEMLAMILCERGTREVEVEHRHIHLPRVLTDGTEGAPGPDGPEAIEALFELYDRFTAAQQHGPDPAAWYATPPQAYAALAQIEFAERFAPPATGSAPVLPWVGYPGIEPDRPAPDAVAYLGSGWFAGQDLYLLYRYEYDPETFAWSGSFALLDASGTGEAWPVAGLADLVDLLAGLRASYDEWCQDGMATAGPFDDDDPYEYCDQPVYD